MQFALISCRRATIETEDLGFIVSSTTRRFFGELTPHPVTLTEGA
jgi:hypothetical protein